MSHEVEKKRLVRFFESFLEAACEVQLAIDQLCVVRDAQAV